MGCLIPFEISKKKGDFCSGAYNTKLEPFKRAKVREKKEVILESSKSFQKNENFEQVLKFRDNRNSKNATGACSTKIVVFFSLKLRLGKRKNKEAKIKEKKKRVFLKMPTKTDTTQKTVEKSLNMYEKKKFR